MRKSIIKFISILFPKLVVSFAYRQLTSPQFIKLRQNEIDVLDIAEKELLKFHDFDIQLYTWKGGKDKVLLIHGWEGQAGNFADLIPKLLQQNYTVHAFDGPSHGFSSKGSTSLFEFVDLVELLIQKYEVRKLVSHSFGGVATTYALHNNQNLCIDRYVLLTTPNKFLERIDDVANKVGITDKVKEMLIQRLEAEIKLDTKKLNVSEFVKNVNVSKSLIIHDTNDTVLPISLSKNVHKNWRNSEFFEVQGTGHIRILRTDFVLEKTVDFLST